MSVLLRFNPYWVAKIRYLRKIWFLMKWVESWDRNTPLFSISLAVSLWFWKYLNQSHELKIFSTISIIFSGCHNVRNDPDYRQRCFKHFKNFFRIVLKHALFFFKDIHLKAETVRNLSVRSLLTIMYQMDYKIEVLLYLDVVLRIVENFNKRT